MRMETTSGIWRSCLRHLRRHRKSENCLGGDSADRQQVTNKNHKELAEYLRGGAKKRLGVFPGRFFFASNDKREAAA